MSKLQEQYAERLPSLEEAAAAIEVLLRESLDGLPRIDAISARVKPMKRFLEKASRRDPTTGDLRYKFPLDDIQDQVGARVVVCYLDDVKPVRERILNEFCHIEDRKQEELDPGRFGYEAHHFVCAMPPEIRVKTNTPIEFAEIQVSTLFQHAWAEANHDLGYKPIEELDFDTQREIAWSAAQAWGADRIFSRLWREARERASNGADKPLLPGSGSNS